MKVILHADDFGFNKDTLDATIECFEQGVLSSCSIMVNCEASEEAFDFARQHPEFSYGVHLTYVDDLIPVMPANEIPTLVGDNGRFMSSHTVRKMALLGKLSHKDVIKESQAQIDKAEGAGVILSHLDSHGHLHKFPTFSYSMKCLNFNEGRQIVKRVRASQNIFIKIPSKTSPKYWLNKYFDWYLKHHFNNPRFFYMSANNMDTGWADNILSQMEFMPHDSVIEIGVHPGHEEKWRQHEFDDIIDFSTKLKKSGKHEIINWKQI